MKGHEKLSLIVGCLALAAAIASGFWGEYLASIVIIGILLVLWGIWITSKVFSLSKKVLRDNAPTTIVAGRSSLLDRPYHRGMGKSTHIITAPEKKIKIPASFLAWDHFTILFWVNVTDEFFGSHSNRYIFSYTTNTNGASKYPNAFYLGIKGGSLLWQFVIKGENPENSNTILFSSAHNLLGWKLFAIRWNENKKFLHFSIDAGHVLAQHRVIPKEFWPKPAANCEFHLGGWQDCWHGGLSLLKFFNFRVFQTYLSDGDLETVLDEEGSLLEGA